MLLSRQKEGGFDKTAKMTTLQSKQQNKGLAAQTPWNDENDENDENDGCHAGKGMIYQKHRFLFPEC